MISEMVKRIEGLCETRHISISKLLKDCDLHGRVVVDMKNRGSMPSADKMLKIANYFGVTTEYLMTGKDPAFTNNGIAAVQGYNYGNATVGNDTVTIEEKELLKIFRSLSFMGRLDLLNKAVDLEKGETK